MPVPMARYLIRFDDICETMSWSVWDAVESVLRDYDVKPIVAVIPRNRDPHLKIEPPRPDFWDRVRAWKTLGWAIGMHGYEHLYVSPSSGIVGLQPRSEFAGLPATLQREKLERGLAVFHAEGIHPDVWVAPSHSFDRSTVSILNELGIRHISDGLFVNPRIDRDGVMWIPQQFWRFRWAPVGVWTVCFHHNRWSSRGAAEFRRNAGRYLSRISSLRAIAADYADGRQRAPGGLVPYLAGKLIGARAALRAGCSR